MSKEIPVPMNSLFYNGSKFKQDLTTLINNSQNKPVCTTVNNSQYNDIVYRMHEVINNMLVTKDLDIKVSEYIYTWGETLSYIAW